MKINKLIAGCLLGACMVACSSNDDESTNQEMGWLELSVSVNSKVNNVVSTPTRSITANSFPVEITGKDGTLNYASVDALGNEPIPLSTGSYVIKAHTPGEIQTKMSEPYYYGETQFTISKGITSNVDVECKMKNTKIQLTYSSEFASTFENWTITITDGSENILAYSNTDGLTPSPVYWLIADNVPTIQIAIRATTPKGTTITDSRSIYKKEGSSSDFWTGNDALIIHMSPAEETDDPFGIKGIDITVDAVFDETEEIVEIPVIPGSSTEEPEKPGTEPENPETPTNGPSLTGKYLTETLNYTVSQEAEAFPDVSINIQAPSGLSSVVVALSTDNTNFEAAASLVGITAKGAELINHADLIDIMELPSEGQTSYVFALGNLSDLLKIYEGHHRFTVTVTDTNKKIATGVLNINITKID